MDIQGVTCGSGDGDAVMTIDDLCERYHARVYRYAMGTLCDHDKASDVVQETFLKALTALDTVRSVASIRPWLFAIAHNEIMASLRKERLVAPLDPDELPGDDGPLDILVRTDIAVVVRGAIDKLPTAYRQVLLLREFEHLSYAEIAVVMGCTEDSVRVRLMRARQSLVKRLQPLFGGEGHHGLS